MKQSIFTVIIFLSLAFQVNSQTKVVKINAIKANNYGVQYSLPKTMFNIHIEYSETIEKAGPYARYASRYLGVSDKDVIFEDQTTYSLDKVYVKDRGIPNKNETYLVEFKARTTSPFVTLTEDGMLIGINTDYQFPQPETPSPIIQENRTISLNPQSILTEEYLHAGSVGKMAEVAAKNIYSIRESRQDIITGEVENMPKDGEALRIVLANLDAQEKLWVELFLGTKEVKKHTHKIEFDPSYPVEKEILFRFSKYLGIVDNEDLSGIPVYMNIFDLETVSIEEPDPKRKIKEPQSIVYNVPGKAKVEIFSGTKNIFQEEFEVVQFGTTQILATSVFDDKRAPVQVIFSPKTGAIRQIIQ